VHGVGGLTGAILTGVFAQKALNDAGADGLLAGNARQLGVQVLACAATGVYALGTTFVILKVIDATLGLRVSEVDEREGLDSTQHGEDAYGQSTAGTSLEYGHGSGGGARPHEAAT
jgi:Amt family ammonium transporter